MVQRARERPAPNTSYIPQLVGFLLPFVLSVGTVPVIYCCIINHHAMSVKYIKVLVSLTCVSDRLGDWMAPSCPLVLAYLNMSLFLHQRLPWESFVHGNDRETRRSTTIRQEHFKETKFEIMKLASHWPKQITWPIPNSKGGEVYSFHGSGRGRSKYF